MNTINGTPVSPGIAIGRALIKKPASKSLVFKRTENKADEKKRFKAARNQAVDQLSSIYEEIRLAKGEKAASIFSAHIEMLDDKNFISSVESIIEEQVCMAEWAVKTARDNFADIFESMDDEYMRARAADIKDISGRIIAILSDDKNGGGLELAEPVIIVSDDLTPSDTALMNPDMVLGIINERGSAVCHAAIIARMLGIPFVVYPQIMALVKDGQQLAFDGETGSIELDVDDEVVRAYSKKREELKKKRLKLERIKGKRSVTRDGFEISLAGNISSPKDTDSVLKEGGNSIGLFRTEFLYMNRSIPPSEEEQFLAYKETAEKMKGGPVIIRTLDIGGDKVAECLNLPREENPFLGYRAIRLCLDRVAFWKTQLRALLRASAFGNVQILFPMIASMDEIDKAKQILEEVKAGLRNDGIAFKENIPVGMMVETPAAVIMSDAFAKEVDFFSIGTNDLIQYTMAVDRMNDKVSYLYSQFDPAVLRSIKKITDSARENGIWTGMCGEVAADISLLPLWIGFGVGELSMSPASILPIKERIQRLSKEECEKLADTILLLHSSEEVKTALGISR